VRCDRDLNYLFALFPVFVIYDKNLLYFCLICVVGDTETCETSKFKFFFVKFDLHANLMDL